MLTAVSNYLVRRGINGARTTLLSGDASTRQYVRLERPDGAPQVLAIYPEPFDPATLPFLNVSALLSAFDAPIPRIHDVAGDLGIVALEDLGDVTVQAFLEAHDRRGLDALYTEAVDLIVRLQRGGDEHRSEAYQPYALAFDVEKLTWELDFFVRHFLGDHRQVVLGDGEPRALADEWRLIAEELAAEPRVLCHRDYHSRNLMVHGGRLVMIDFQDARLGPDTYDLVSLLRDSYVTLPDDLVARLIARFLSLAAHARRPVPDGDASLFRRRFDLMAMQRNLKALGTFGYQVAVRGKAHYAESVPRTLAYVRDTARRNPRFGRLQEILARHIPELR
jgi:aminoglycoside/choline kinase family phosphotransferase